MIQIWQSYVSVGGGINYFGFDIFTTVYFTTNYYPVTAFKYFPNKKKSSPYLNTT
jgi:hypothetical protein